MAIFAGAVFPGSSGPLLPAMRPAIAGEFASRKKRENCKQSADKNVNISPIRVARLKRL